MDYFKWKELNKLDEVKPFTPKQTKEEIKLETDNFTLDKGVFRYGFEEEARIAVKYLEQKGYHAEMNITDNPLFAPEHESYNVWFSKEELPDGYESGEWLKEDLEEPEEYFVGSVAIAGTPEEAQKEFKELGYNVRVEKSAIDHFDTYYLIDIYGSKEELERLANDPVEQGLFIEDEIKSTLEEGRRKKALDKGMGMWQWPNPEKGVEMFNHAVGADAVSAGASESLKEEAMYGLFLEVKDLNGEVVKEKMRIDLGSQSEMEEKKVHLEDVSPKDPAGNDNIYTVEFFGNSSFREELEEDILNKESSYILLWKDEDLGFHHLPLTEKEKDEAIVLIELLTNDRYNKVSDQEMDFVEYKLDYLMDEYEAGDYIFVNLSPDEVEKYKKEKIYKLIDLTNNLEEDEIVKTECLKESKEISLPHLDALFETEGFNAPFTWEFEGETETEESPFHFTYRVEEGQLKIYDEHEEFSIDYGEDFGYRPRDKKLDKIEKALKEDGFGDEVLEWENNVIMSIHIPENKLKEELTESKLSWEDAIKDSYHSLISSSGQAPTASQVLEDVADHYDLGIDVKIELDDPFKYNKWLTDVEHVLNTLGLEVLGEGYPGKTGIQYRGYYIVFGNNNRDGYFIKDKDNNFIPGISGFATEQEAMEYIDNHLMHKENSSLTESTSKYPEFLGFINGTLEELNPKEFIDKVKARRQSLHTNRIAESSEDGYVVYTITCDLLGFDLDTCDVYIDVIKEEWNRKHGVDMDDPESYKFEETQERVLMEDCGEGPDKWDKAIEVIQNFKDEHTNKNESLKEEVESKGVQIAKIVADLFKGECGPFAGEDPIINGNSICLYSQATAGDEYTFNDDGSIDVDSQYEGPEEEEEDEDGYTHYHYNSFRELTESGDGWFYDIDSRTINIVEDQIKEIFGESLKEEIETSGYESDTEMLLKEIANELDMPYDSEEVNYDMWNYISLLHDVNNGRGDEWVEDFEEKELNPSLLNAFKRLVLSEDDIDFSEE